METVTGRIVAKLEDPHGDRATWQSFTPDGTQLVVASNFASAVHVWDLRAIRTRLKAMNLDWDWPEFPTAAASDPNGADAGLYDLGLALNGQKKLKAGNVLWQQENQKEALAAYQEAVRSQPGNAEIHTKIGWVYAQLGQWDKAATHAGKALALRHSLELWWMYYASFLLRAGDKTGYRDVCKRMLEQFRETKHPWVASRVALTCLLITDPVGDREALLDLAKWSEAAAPPHDACYTITLGIACYRNDQFEQAARLLRQALKEWPDNPYDSRGAAEEGAPVLAWLVLAMTHHRLDRGEVARLWLTKAIRKMDQELAETGVGHLRKQCHVWAMCQVLRAEAETLLK
jgi:tetratricopeptide (TPR) repeat protein